MIDCEYDPMMVAEGRGCMIMRSPELHKGECYMVPKIWNVDEISEWEKTYKALKQARMTTYDYFEIDNPNKRIRVPDLTNGGRNLVVSYPDFINLCHNSSDQAGLWIAACANHRTINDDRFLTNLWEDLNKAVLEEIVPNEAAYILVVTPNGLARCVFADFHDGYKYSDDFIDPRDRVRYFRGGLNHFLTETVAVFFPQLKNKVQVLYKRSTGLARRY